MMMLRLLLTLLLYSFLAALIIAHTEECGTLDPTPERLQHEKTLLARYRRGTRGTRMFRSSNSSEEALCIQCVEIGVAFHILETTEIITVNSTSKWWTETFIQDQMTALSAGFNETPFRFTLRNTTLTYDDAAAQAITIVPIIANYSLWEVSQRLRVGGATTMNVYVNKGTCVDQMGYTQPPNEFGTFPEGTYSAFDLVALCDEIGRPNSTNVSSRTTLIHEAGHWLGLHHSFNENYCHSSLQDLVDDTPAQSEPTRECHTGKDSCPNHPGVATGVNFMDYSDCRSEFTAGQIERMWAIFNTFRQRLEPCDGAAIRFALTFHDGRPNHLDFAYRAYGIEPGPLTTLMPAFQETQVDFAQRLIQRELCVGIHDLHEIMLVDQYTVLNIERDVVSFSLNGRQVFDQNDVKGNRISSILVAGDANKCNAGQTRLTLDLLFGLSDVEGISWTLSDSRRSTVVDWVATTVARSLTYSNRVFQGKALFFDECLSPGEYNFQISVPSGALLSDYIQSYRLGLDDGEEIYNGNEEDDVVILIRPSAAASWPSEAPLETVAPTSPKTAAPLTPLQTSVPTPLSHVGSVLASATPTASDGNSCTKRLASQFFVILLATTLMP